MVTAAVGEGLSSSIDDKCVTINHRTMSDECTRGSVHAGARVKLPFPPLQVVSYQ